jgi:hypothetical protein
MPSAFESANGSEQARQGLQAEEGERPVSCGVDGLSTRLIPVSVLLP